MSVCLDCARAREQLSERARAHGLCMRKHRAKSVRACGYVKVCLSVNACTCACASACRRTCAHVGVHTCVCASEFVCMTKRPLRPDGGAHPRSHSKLSIRLHAKYLGRKQQTFISTRKFSTDDNTCTMHTDSACRHGRIYRDAMAAKAQARFKHACIRPRTL